MLRRWRVAAFVVFVLAVESASYRATTLVVHRHRPRVLRLEQLPVNASYPSGHTAAAIAVYGGLVLLLTSMVKNRVFRALAWTIAVAIPVFVAVSRMYRGMHHPLDVAGGVLVGIAALIVLVFACRAAGAAADSRREDNERRPVRAARWARARREGRGDRALRQDARRRARRAAARPRGRGNHGSALV